jgi:hypothetical protein
MSWFPPRWITPTLPLCVFWFVFIKFEDEKQWCCHILAVAHRCLKVLFCVFQLPPSYEQVIKEINQVQVNTTNNTNATATSRSTITSATQTDFPEQLDNTLPQSNASNLSPLALSYFWGAVSGKNVICNLCIICWVLRSLCVCTDYYTSFLRAAARSLGLTLLNVRKTPSIPLLVHVTLYILHSHWQEFYI